jgi:glycosyltransferase involved in cell wall biosynthesis
VFNMNEKCVRILRIVSVMNRGGIETQIMNIYRKLDREKFQFDFLVTRDEKGLFDEEIEQLGGRIFRIPSVRDVGLTKFIRNVDDFFKQHKEYKIVHCHMNTWSGLFLNIAKRHNIPVRISHSHSAQQGFKNSSVKGFIENCFKRLMKQFIKKGATHFWAVGKEAGEWLYGKKIAQNNMEIFTNSKDLEAYKYDLKARERLRNELGIPLEAFVIGHVGSFTPVKNHTFVIKIFDHITKSGIDCRLCLTGNGPLKDNIEKEAIDKELNDKVLFLGLRNDVNKLMSVFDVLVLPSIFEGMPNVVIEAQAASLPCVVSSSVTHEIDMGIGIVSFKPLEDSIYDWSKLLLSKNTQGDRHINLEKIRQKGYDLNSQIKWLENFYNSSSS